MIRSLFKITIYAIIITFSLEVTLYLAGIPKEYAPHTWPLQFQSHLDKEIGWTNLRSASIDFTYDGNTRGYFKDNNTVSHITNSAGFRGPEIIFKKPENTTRVIFLGDSLTFGIGTYFKDTYPEQFKIIGQERNVFNKNIESINLAVCGYNTSQEYTMLKKSSDLNPDYIVVGYFLNDARGLIFNMSSSNKFEYINYNLHSSPPSLIF